MGALDRVKRNSGGDKIFLPMNVEGGADDGFFTPGKLAASIAFGMLALVDYVSLVDQDAPAKTFIIHTIVLLLIGQWIVRYILIGEKYYYKMYKKQKKNRVTTPAFFWDIPNIQDKEEGGLIVYSDMKVGAIIKLERDTIVGRDSEFRSNHYDMVSDFFKELNGKGLQWVYLNIMERSSNDPRLHELDNVVVKCPNENIKKLTSLHLGFLKVVARNTLYESEYYLIYTKQSQKIDTILSDIEECAFNLMNGAYNGFSILSKEEIFALAPDYFDVRYFNPETAIMEVFRRTNSVSNGAFKILDITFNDDEIREVGDKENLILRNLTSAKKKGKLIAGEWTIREALDGKLGINSNVNNGAKAGTKPKKGTAQGESELEGEENENMLEDEELLDAVDAAEILHESGDNEIEDIELAAEILREQAARINQEAGGIGDGANTGAGISTGKKKEKAKKTKGGLFGGKKKAEKGKGKGKAGNQEMREATQVEEEAPANEGEADVFETTKEAYSDDYEGAYEGTSTTDDSIIEFSDEVEEEEIRNLFNYSDDEDEEETPEVNDEASKPVAGKKSLFGGRKKEKASAGKKEKPAKKKKEEDPEDEMITAEDLQEQMMKEFEGREVDKKKKRKS